MRTVSPRFFVDTNVLVYVYDLSDAPRRERAVATVERLRESHSGVISTQVLSELFRALTRPRGLGMPSEVAEQRVLGYVYSWPVLDVRPLHVVEAMRGVRDHKLSYYDALIWATARLNEVPYLLSEDGQDGRLIEGVRTFNPLSPEFDLSMLS